MIALAGGLFLALVVDAQQVPEYGCRMALSCRPAGFSILDKERSLYGFGFGFRWDPGFELNVAGTKNYPVLQETPLPPPPVEPQVFHLGVRLLLPPPTPTPVPAAPGDPKKD